VPAALVTTAADLISTWQRVQRRAYDCKVQKDTYVLLSGGACVQGVGLTAVVQAQQRLLLLPHLQCMPYETPDCTGSRSLYKHNMHTFTPYIRRAGQPQLSFQTFLATAWWIIVCHAIALPGQLLSSHTPHLPKACITNESNPEPRTVLCYCLPYSPP
jgi:hypothetical protein